MRTRLLCLAVLPVLAFVPAAFAEDQPFAAMIFDRLDADGNGDVTGAEIAAAKGRQFARADHDGDGLVTEEELATIRDRLSRLARIGGDGLTEGARRLDRDGDNAVSLAEYSAPSPFFTLIDADDNGAISRAEFDRARAAFSPQP